jgi:hypothetical protein
MDMPAIGFLIFVVVSSDGVFHAEIRSARELRGKKIGGSTPGGTASSMADLVRKHFGLEPGRDVAVVLLWGSRVAAWESGAVWMRRSSASRKTSSLWTKGGQVVDYSFLERASCNLNLQR